MRPRGSHGEVAMALRKAAADGGPAPVRVLAERAQVGYSTARYTASRLVDAGYLVLLDDARPSVLAVPPSGDTLADKLDELHRQFWVEL